MRARMGCGALVLLSASCGGATEQAPLGNDASIRDDFGAITTPDSGERLEDGGTLFVRASAAPGSGTEADPYGDLQRAIDLAPNGATLIVEGGTYTATPSPAVEADTRVQYTHGFTIRGKSLAIEGKNRAAVRIETRSGYGVLIEDSPRVSIRGLTISGGARDAEEAATSAAIVARNTTLQLEDLRISGNTGLRPGNAYPGISAIVAREGARLTISGVEIRDNSWDGVSIHDDGRVTIVNSDLFGSDGIGLSARGSGELVAINNRVDGYWRSVAGFEKSAVVAKNNQLVAASGAGAWAAGDSDSIFELLNNLIFSAENCGFAIEAEAKGRAVNNIIAFGGTEDSWLCPKTGVWTARDPAGRFGLSYNLVWSHGQTAVLSGGSADGTGGADISARIVGASGNISADPRFSGDRDFRLSAGSPAIDSGDPTLLDRDGTRSDMGHLGGPDAERNR